MLISYRITYGRTSCENPRDRTRESGRWKKERVVSEILKRRYSLNGFNYVNGSVLFGKTAFSARHMVKLLRRMSQVDPPLPEFAASLAVNGVDGTLKRRMKGIKRGMVRAKTGTLDGVVCLSGYFRFANGRMAYSVFLSMKSRDVLGRSGKFRTRF